MSNVYYLRVRFSAVFSHSLLIRASLFPFFFFPSVCLCLSLFVLDHLSFVFCFYIYLYCIYAHLRMFFKFSLIWSCMWDLRVALNIHIIHFYSQTLIPSSRPPNGSMTSGQREEATLSSCWSGTRRILQTKGAR